MKPRECEYCNEEIEGKAHWERKLDGWVCETCKETLDNEDRK